MAARLQAVLTRRGVNALVLAGIAGGLGEVIARRGDADAPAGSLAALLVCAVALTAPFLLWRVTPFLASVGMYASALAISFVERQVVTHLYVSLLAAVAAGFLLGTSRERAPAVGGLAFAYASLVIIVRNDPDGVTGDIVKVGLLITAAWLAGLALRQKRQQAEAAEQRAVQVERERERRELEAVVEERARIARELHDVVAHSVSVMTVQAGAVLRLLHPDQEREREALEAIAHTGRDALGEMRRLVGVMKQPEEAPALAPQPSLDDLERLVEHVREAGLAVRLQIEGEPTTLPVGIDVSAYRIVQEGLTNTLKHAHATSADVHVRYGDDVVELVVSDNGRGSSNGSAAGHGLVGMRERVAIYGGEIVAGPRQGGGYEVRARLPVTT